MDVLNRALDWRHAAPLGSEPDAARAATILPPEALRLVLRDVTLLRRIFAVHYVEATPAQTETEALNLWLAAVTLRVTPSRDSHRQRVLQASRRQPLYPEPFEGLLSSALVQLLGTVPETTAMSAIHRCHGIGREMAPADDFEAGEGDWPRELEGRFAQRAGIQRLVTAPLRQCARLVVSERGSRYCSKACSNASFALRKSHDDPRYFAHKQERYRHRKQKRLRGAAAQVDRGAFVYME